MSAQMLLIAVFVAAAAAGAYPPPAAAGGNAFSSAQQQRLMRLVRHDCGSCHGMTLAGGLGPDIRPAAVAARGVAYLAAFIRHGAPERGMPPWGPLLSDAEIAWIAEGLLDGRFLPEVKP